MAIAGSLERITANEIVAGTITDDKLATPGKILQVVNLSPSESWVEKVVEVHPMKQIAIMSVVQIVVLGFMGASMLVIGFFFS